jgi:UDP-3-O-[3-hydroxymyristoyl] glucosamine N-acyltransferase
MADPRFFTPQGPFDLATLAGFAAATLADDADPDKTVKDVATLDGAGPDDISFLDNLLYRDQFASSGAGACVVAPKFAALAPEGMSLLLSEAPYKAYALIARAFYPETRSETGIAAGAVVHDTAHVAADGFVAAGAVVGAGAEIGARSVVGVNAVIGEGVIIGEDTQIGACASLSHCRVGHRVIVHPGASIGQDGFGFAPDPEGHVKVPQLGRVVIEDDVEIGANATIDRGSGPDTVIGRGSKIDNLVQIGHNVQIGKGCFVVAQVGISGSTRIGDHVSLAGQAGLIGHLKIGDGARVGAQAGVARDVPAGATVAGSPAVPVIQWHRQTAALARLVKPKGSNR